VAYPDGRLSTEAGLVREAAASGTLVGLAITESAPIDERGALDGSRFIERLCSCRRTTNNANEDAFPIRKSVEPVSDKNAQEPGSESTLESRL
jgi:hypothetical protein